MKQCPNCNAQIDDAVVFCPICGFNTSAGAPNQAPQQPQQQWAQQPVQPMPTIDPTDHTAEFESKDISDNKIIAMCVYLIGTIGIIIALLAAQNSKYAAFHVRQGLKISVVEILTIMAMAILCWTIIVPIVGCVFLGVLAVIKIICFVQICQGKAKEPPIVKAFGFLK